LESIDDSEPERLRPIGMGVVGVGLEDMISFFQALIIVEISVL
jgi:hypothetical protein